MAASAISLRNRSLLSKSQLLCVAARAAFKSGSTIVAPQQQQEEIVIAHRLRTLLPSQWPRRDFYSCLAPPSSEGERDHARPAHGKLMADRLTGLKSGSPIFCRFSQANFFATSNVSASRKAREKKNAIKSSDKSINFGEKVREKKKSIKSSDRGISGGRIARQKKKIVKSVDKSRNEIRRKSTKGDNAALSSAGNRHNKVRRVPSNTSSKDQGNLLDHKQRGKRRLMRFSSVRTTSMQPRRKPAARQFKNEERYKGIKSEDQNFKLDALSWKSNNKTKRFSRSESKNSLLHLELSNVVKHKKGKRRMRLDPNDNTSKRAQDDSSSPGCKENPKKTSQEQVELSKNAQFRSIQPSQQLLLHIDRYMLGRRRSSEWQKAGYNVKLTAPLDDVPHANKDERQPIEEEVFRHKLRFAAAAKISSSFPPVELPEVAFAGRSNVGKSSLINALTRRWGVARTSDKPGLTQTINFFRLGGRLCLVDLPGYGFAYAEEEKKEAWEELVKEYASSREGLRRVCLLIDAKWGLRPRDEELVALMESSGTRYQIVLTKVDTILPIDLARRATQIQEVFKNNKLLIQPLMMASSKSGGGLGLLRASLAKLAKASVI